MKPAKLKAALERKIPKKLLPEVISAYDRVGDMIILDIPEVLEKYEKVIGKLMLDMHPGVKVVSKKVGIHYGKDRKQKVKLLVGEKRKTALYTENAIRMYVNYEDAYFSPRLSQERLRISKLVKKGEDILVMFSGIAPYCLTIRKHTEAGKIVGVEMNPKGHALAEKNVKLNKMQGIELHCGDVKLVVPKLQRKFDHIVMPLPKTAMEFLDIAIKRLKKGGIIHYYAFWHEHEFSEEKKELKKYCKDLGYAIKIKKVVKCGPSKPRVYRVCVDLTL